MKIRMPLRSPPRALIEVEIPNLASCVNLKEPALADDWLLLTFDEARDLMETLNTFFKDSVE